MAAMALGQDTAQGDLWPAAEPPEAKPPELAVPAGMGRVSFPAMGTTVLVLLPERWLQAGTEAVRELFAQWEQTLSRFRPDSELSALNGRAGEAVAVSPLLYQVVVTALAAARATGGLYDPTLLRQLERVGYDRSFEALSARVADAADAAGQPGPGGGWRHIVVDPARHRVTLPRDAGLDLGGIAKGLAVDAAVTRLREMGIAPALVSAGGDLAVIGLPPGQDAWPIAIQGRAGHRADWVVPLHHGALATSSVERRRWRQGDRARHHLLDPRSGLPAWSGLWSVTVAAARCVQADVAAKVAFVLGVDEGARFLEERGLAGWLVRDDGTARAAGAWPVSAKQLAISD